MRNKNFMNEALLEAQKAFEKGEVPIGAVIVKDGDIIARGHNLVETMQDATYHAEIVAIQKAAKILNNWRLLDCTIYVTLEPCQMCMGAIVEARIPRLVWGAPITGQPVHFVHAEGGLLFDRCGSLIQSFFQRRRDARRNDQESRKTAFEDCKRDCPTSHS